MPCTVTRIFAARYEHHTGTGMPILRAAAKSIAAFIANVFLWLAMKFAPSPSRTPPPDGGAKPDPSAPGGIAIPNDPTQAAGMYREVFDPEAEARSLMMKRPRKCDGEADGFECAHYWYQEMPMRMAHADLLKIGERTRACVLPGAGLCPMNDLYDMPSRCSQYAKSDRPYDPSTREYAPLSPEEVEQVRIDAEAAAAVPSTEEA